MDRAFGTVQNRRHHVVHRDRNPASLLQQEVVDMIATAIIIYHVFC